MGMRRLAARLAGMRLRGKIMLLCTLTALMTALCFSLVLYRDVSATMRGNTQQHAQRLAIQVDAYFNAKIRSVIAKTFAMFYNKSYTDSLMHYLAVDETQYFAQVSSLMMDWAAEMEYADDLIGSVYVYTPKAGFFKNSKILDPAFSFEESLLNPALAGHADDTIYQPGLIRDPIFSDHAEVIPLVIRFRVSGYRDDLYVVVNMSRNAIVNYLRSMGMEDVGLMVLGEAGQLLVGTAESISGEWLENQAEYVAGGRWQQTEQGLFWLGEPNTLRWRVGVLYDTQQLFRQLGTLVALCWVLAGSVAVVAIVAAAVVSRSIAQPLWKLEAHMEALEQGKYEAPLEPTRASTYEVVRLERGFDHMAQQIDGLISELNQTIEALQKEREQVELEQKLKRQAELQTLQAQIKPHFLYNTLNSIIWLAQRHGAEDVQLLATDLGTFFRHSLNGGKELLSFEEEFAQVQSYLNIQKIRYGEILSFSLDLPQAYRTYRTLKLIVQPLVENAIYHGLRERAEQGWVGVMLHGEGEDEDSGLPQAFCIIVEDNGCGMSPAYREALNKRLAGGGRQEGEGYGVFNVNLRIRLFAGDGYGLHYEAREGGGLRAVLRLPVSLGEEGVHVYADHRG